MYKKKKLKTHYIVTGIIVALLIILAILSRFIDDKRKLTLPEKIIKDTGLFINTIFYAPTNYISGIIKERNEKNNIYDKYKKLEEQVDSINELNAINGELKDELAKLKKVLELNESLYDYQKVTATVINRNLGYWFNTITIGKGSSSGLKEGMPAITKDGLIGKIISTTNFTSTIKLITTEDTNNKVSVKINVNDKYIYGILSSYDINNKVFTVDGIDQNVDIPSDSIIVTSGLSDLFPSGIVVGKVTTTKTDNFDLAKTLEVKSLVDFDDISFVTILIKEVTT